MRRVEGGRDDGGRERERRRIKRREREMEDKEEGERQMEDKKRGIIKTIVSTKHN